MVYGNRTIFAKSPFKMMAAANVAGLHKKQQKSWHQLTSAAHSGQ
ncbi:hypothetical protein ACN6MY_09455 [Peribacillus sp. B-H-3]|jgi:hypothetical protein